MKWQNGREISDDRQATCKTSDGQPFIIIQLLLKELFIIIYKRPNLVELLLF